MPRSAQRDRAPGAQRHKSEVKCANCIKTCHTTAGCRQPETEKRKCSIGLQEGYQARNRPDKDKSKPAHARLLDQNGKTFFTVDADGFVPVQRQRRKPEPRKATLAEFMERKVREEEESAIILVGQIWEPPEVS